MSAKEKMTNNYLITVTSLDILKLKVKNINFLFPIKDLSVGFKKTFSVEEININNSYLLINRLLDKSSIPKIENLLKQNLTHIKGICFTDLALINLVKEANLNLELIYFQSHNTTNYASINYYLEYVDSLLISTDLTEEEIITILDKAQKPLVVPYFILNDVMYSRRNLLTNNQKHFSLPLKKEMVLKEEISKSQFLAIENEYGTVFYNQKYLDWRGLKHKNILYRYINPLNLSESDVLKIINQEDLKEISFEGFLHTKTYWKLKEKEK